MTAATPLELLRSWLGRQVPAQSYEWLEEKAAQLATAPPDRDLYLAISLVPRIIGKDDVRLDAADMAAAEAARPGWRPRDWSTDQAARLVLFLSAKGEPGAHKRWLDQLCITGDVGELVAFYRGLPLYPSQEDYVKRALEGARTNMKAVFEALAHNSPYPRERFDENAWNHMVLKALFIGSPLHPIQGLDERANAALARMLCDYAHERWAAGRSVSPELWRCVGPLADEAALDDLERVLNTGVAEERQAAAIALGSCSTPRARALLKGQPDLAEAVEQGRLSWARLAARSAP